MAETTLSRRAPGRRTILVIMVLVFVTWAFGGGVGTGGSAVSRAAAVEEEVASGSTSAPVTAAARSKARHRGALVGTGAGDTAAILSSSALSEERRTRRRRRKKQQQEQLTAVDGDMAASTTGHHPADDLAHKDHDEDDSGTDSGEVSREPSSSSSDTPNSVVAGSRDADTLAAILESIRGRGKRATALSSMPSLPAAERDCMCRSVECMTSVTFDRCLDARSSARAKAKMLSVDDFRAQLRDAWTDTARHWVAVGGIARRHLVAAAKGSSSINVFVEPPHVHLLDGGRFRSSKFQDPEKRAELFLADLKDAVQDEGFVANWQRFVGMLMAPEGAAAAANHTSRRGFFLAVHFEDYGDESGASAGFAAYAQQTHTPLFVVWDPYMRNLSVPASYANARFDVFAEELHSMANSTYPLPWKQRRSQVFFRGSPTHRLRKKLTKAFEVKSSTEKSWTTNNFNIRWAYTGNVAQLQPLSEMLDFKAVWALRGQSASLRDRLLLLSGATLIRVEQPFDEPWQLYHRAMQPWVHYVPLYYNATKFKLASSQLRHLQVDSLEPVLRHMFDERADELEDIAVGGRRIGELMESREVRRAALIDALFMYLAVLNEPAALSHDGAAGIAASR